METVEFKLNYHLPVQDSDVAETDRLNQLKIEAALDLDNFWAFLIIITCVCIMLVLIYVVCN